MRKIFLEGSLAEGVRAIKMWEPFDPIGLLLQMGTQGNNLGSGKKMNVQGFATQRYL